MTKCDGSLIDKLKKYCESNCSPLRPKESWMLYLDDAVAIIRRHEAAQEGIRGAMAVEGEYAADQRREIRDNKCMVDGCKAIAGLTTHPGDPYCAYHKNESCRATKAMSVDEEKIKIVIFNTIIRAERGLKPSERNHLMRIIYQEIRPYLRTMEPIGDTYENGIRIQPGDPISLRAMQPKPVSRGDGSTRKDDLRGEKPEESGAFAIATSPTQQPDDCRKAIDFIYSSIGRDFSHLTPLEAAKAWMDRVLDHAPPIERESGSLPPSRAKSSIDYLQRRGAPLSFYAGIAAHRYAAACTREDVSHHDAMKAALEAVEQSIIEGHNLQTTEIEGERK